MDQPVRRSTASIVGVCLFVLLIAVGGAALAWQLRSDDESQPEAGSYESVRVPWWDGRNAHWAGQAARMGEIASLTATQDAALFLHDRRSADFGDDDEFVAAGHGTLTALFADGTAEQLAERVVLVPLADPNGRVVAWTALVGKHTVRITAYDTSDRVVLGSQQMDEEEGMLTAVVGDTVYLATEKGALAWQPREGTEPRLVRGTGDWPTVVGTSNGGLLAMNQEWKMAWLAGDGTVERVKRFLGSISPDGEYAAVPGGPQGYSRHVREALSGERIQLDLPEEEQAYETRWAADGTLVVAAVHREDLKDGWDDAFRVRNYACEVPSGKCRRLEGGPSAIYHLPVYEDSYYGVIGVAFEGIGS